MKSALFSFKTRRTDLSAQWSVEYLSLLWRSSTEDVLRSEERDKRASVTRELPFYTLWAGEG